MRLPWIICGLFFFTPFASAPRTCAQTDVATAQNAPRYNLSIAVDEVSLTFHAADAHGLPINDLKLDELRIFDNEKPPRKILAFQSLENFPIRAGFLLDTSDSVEGYLPRNRAISIEYAQQLLRQQTDLAFVMDFNSLAEVAQPWTSNPAALTAGIRRFTKYGESRIGGTAIFSAIYQACLNQFDKIDHAPSGNFILLFSDGEDNASRADLKQAVDMCQRANTAIYAFRVESPYSSSSGPKTLAELTSQTGGRVFFDDDSDVGIYNDLRTIEADLRNRYHLIYKPEALKHDGSFHKIDLLGPERAGNIIVRSGYYAPAH
jgi:Ca-activated chloride channel family protein